METMTERVRKLFPQIHAIRFNMLQSTFEAWEKTIELSPRLQGKTHVTNLLNNVLSGKAHVEENPNTGLRMISTNNIVIMFKKIIEGLDIDDLNHLYMAFGELEQMIKDSIEKRMLLDK